jgi:hypothetical protein
MTSRPTFGDFIDTAHWHLDPATTVHGPPGARGSAEEVSRSLLRVITVMHRYVEDMTITFPDMRSRPHPELDAWASAAIEARVALVSAAGFLDAQGAISPWPAVPAASPLARRLDGVAESLITGRDLLQTHFGLDWDGRRQHRSEWAFIITSPTATRAILVEFAALSRTIAAQGANLALAYLPGGRDNADARRALNAACQWLWVLNASVQAAHAWEPAPAIDGDLLRSIPLNAAPPRRLPERGDPVAALCEGTISTAERLRHLAWDAAARAPWSSGLSVASMYQVAAANTVTSHNSEVLLRILAARTAHPGFGQVSAQLSVAADAAARTRQAWLGVAHALDDISTDAKGRISRAAAETRDLAQWSGRLAYANPDWTPATGPAQAARAPDDLAPEPQQVPLVIAAAHQLSVALTRLAYAEQEQIHAADQAGRILVTTRSLSDEYDIPRPFARAPLTRVERLLARYREAAHSSQQITAAVAPAAEATRAPSRILTAAAAALGHVGAHEIEKLPNGFAPMPACPEADDRPGPVEHTLRRLGVSRVDLLRRGAELDQASSRLIIDAANDLDPGQRRPSAMVLNRSAGTAEVVNHALASGNPRAAALLRQHARPERESPEPEP